MSGTEGDKLASSSMRQKVLFLWTWSEMFPKGSQMMWRFSVRWDVLGMILPLCDSLRRRRLQPDCKKWFNIYYLKPRPDPPRVEVLLSQMALLKSLRVHQPLHKDTKYLCTLCSLFSFSVLQVNIPPAKGQRLHCFPSMFLFFLRSFFPVTLHGVSWKQWQGWVTAHGVKRTTPSE